MGPVRLQDLHLFEAGALNASSKVLKAAVHVVTTATEATYDSCLACFRSERKKTFAEARALQLLRGCPAQSQKLAIVLSVLFYIFDSSMVLHAAGMMSMDGYKHMPPSRWPKRA